MDDYFYKYGRVPSNLNMVELLEGVDGNKTKKQYLKDGIVYFLSKLSKDNYSQFKKDEGFVILNEEILSNVIGKDRPSIIVKILISNDVVEVKNYRNGHQSRSYRLKEPYITTIFNEVEFSERIKNKLWEYHLKREEMDSGTQINNISYTHVFNQFKKNRIQIDISNMNIFLKNLGIQLINKHQHLKKEQYHTYSSILNYIGKSIEIAKDINEDKFRMSIANSNKRFHSNLTSLPKIIRPFLTINGDSIGEVDLNASQPYILSTILNDNFILNDSNYLNLKNIYPELYTDFINLKTAVPSNKKGNPNYMLGIYFSDKELQGLKEFSEFDFSKDFYQHITNKGWETNPEYMSSKKKFRDGRDYIKKHIMTLLFDKNKTHRNNDSVVKLVKLVYPELNELVERFYVTYSQRDISVLLQRVESFLMLQNVCLKIEKINQSIPYFTIHDSIITNTNYLETVKTIVQETINNITVKTPGLKIKVITHSTEVTNKLVNEIWNKVKITSPGHYDKMKWYILQKNIDTGKELLGIQ